MLRPAETDQSAVYEIRVQGALDEDWSDWFNGLSLACVNGRPPMTILTGFIIDQASLRGILNHLWDLNLILISVTRMPPSAAQEPSADA